MDQEPNDIIWVSWGKYDLRQLRDDCKLHKIDREWINENNHRSLKHLHAEWNKLNPKGIGMNGALKMENIELEGTHHRVDDARNIAKIFKKYIAKF